MDMNRKARRQSKAILSDPVQLNRLADAVGQSGQSDDPDDAAERTIFLGTLLDAAEQANPTAYDPHRKWREKS
jgi:hypothetical protein